MSIMKRLIRSLAREDQGLVVDALNNPIGLMHRNRINSEKLFYRQPAVIVTSGAKIYVQQRSFHKDCHPGFWDIAMGGHIQEGETDEFAALRELEEELGVRDMPLKHICTMSIGNEGWFSWVVFYHVNWNGPVQITREETEQVQLLTLDDIKKMIWNNHPFTPLSLRFLEVESKFLENQFAAFK